MPRDEFEALTLAELTQFAFARGEEVVLRQSSHADAVFKAIDAAFSKEPGKVFDDYRLMLMGRIHYRQAVSEDDFIDYNTAFVRQQIY